jgi:hypothetical protein
MQAVAEIAAERRKRFKRRMGDGGKPTTWLTAAYIAGETAVELERAEAFCLHLATA